MHDEGGEFCRAERPVVLAVFPLREGGAETDPADEARRTQRRDDEFVSIRLELARKYLDEFVEVFVSVVAVDVFLFDALLDRRSDGEHSVDLPSELVDEVPNDNLKRGGIWHVGDARFERLKVDEGDEHGVDEFVFTAECAEQRPLSDASGLGELS